MSFNELLDRINVEQVVLPQVGGANTPAVNEAIRRAGGNIPAPPQPEDVPEPQPERENREKCINLESVDQGFIVGDAPDAPLGVGVAESWGLGNLGMAPVNAIPVLGEGKLNELVGGGVVSVKYNGTAAALNATLDNTVAALNAQGGRLSANSAERVKRHMDQLEHSEKRLIKVQELLNMLVRSGRATPEGGHNIDELKQNEAALRADVEKNSKVALGIVATLTRVVRDAVNQAMPQPPAGADGAADNVARPPVREWL